MDLTRHIPWRRLRAPLLASAVPIACFAWFAIQAGEWQTAVRRCLTLRGSYTTVAVRPGPEFVLAGQPHQVDATLSGRSASVVEVQYRPHSSRGAWQRSEMNRASRA